MFVQGTRVDPRQAELLRMNAQTQGQPTRAGLMQMDEMFGQARAPMMGQMGMPQGPPMGWGRGTGVMNPYQGMGGMFGPGGGGMSPWGGFGGFGGYGDPRMQQMARYQQAQMGRPSPGMMKQMDAQRNQQAGAQQGRCPVCGR